MPRYLEQYATDVFNKYMAEDTRAAVRMIQAARPKSVAVYLSASVAVMLQRCSNGDALAADFLTALEGATNG